MFLNIILSEISFLGFPSTFEKCVDLEQVFSNSCRAHHPFPGCVEELDGIAVIIINSLPFDCADPSSYYHMKVLYAILMHVFSDSVFKLMFFLQSVQVHRMIMFLFLSLPLQNYYNIGKLPDVYWIASDGPYVYS